MKLYYISTLGLLLFTTGLVNSYITSPLAVPLQRQVEWLNQMTVDICESRPGELTDEMLQKAPQIMRAWSETRKGDMNCALAVESLVKRIIDERQAGNTDAVASTDDYNCLMEGWGRSDTGAAGAERCEQILTMMQEQFEDGDETVQPNLQSFKVALLAWGQSRVNFAPHRAQRLLEWMVGLVLEGGNELALPDADCFDIVLQLWSRSGRPDAPKRTEELLKTMERMYFATGRESLCPRTSSFNAVLLAWAKSGRNESSGRALDILSFMENLAESGTNDAIVPDQASYTTVLNAYQKQPSRVSASIADRILHRVEDLHKKDRISFAPDTIMYNSAMGCCARSNEKGAYKLGRTILDRQISRTLEEDGVRGCKPDVYGFTSVIASCAMERGSRAERKVAFKVAKETFEEIEKFDHRNHVTYGAMLKACSKLLWDSPKCRTRWATEIFNMSVKDGCVGDMVMSRLNDTVSPAVYRTLTKGHNRYKLPSEWTKNVDEKNAYKRKKSAWRGKRAEV